MDQNNRNFYSLDNQYREVLYLSGIGIGLSERLSWIIRKGSSYYELTNIFLEKNEFIVWLPLLENNVTLFDQQLKEGIYRILFKTNVEDKESIFQSFPKQVLVLIALKSNSEYWISLGLKWLETFENRDIFKKCLMDIASNKKISQKIRHLSQKLSPN